jgi:hypothetical protein
MTLVDFEQIAREVVEPRLAEIGFQLAKSIRNGRWYCDEYHQAPGWSVAVFYELGDWYPDVRAHRPDGGMLNAEQYSDSHQPFLGSVWPEIRLVSDDGRALVRSFHRLFCLLAAELSGPANE